VEPKGTEEWTEYDPHLMMLKINVWRPDIEFLDEAHLKPIRYQIDLI